MRIGMALQRRLRIDSVMAEWNQDIGLRDLPAWSGACPMLRRSDLLLSTRRFNVGSLWLFVVWLASPVVAHRAARGLCSRRRRARRLIGDGIFIRRPR